MDEPSSNLDEDAAQELGAVLMELKRQGYALVVAEHRISYLMECADRFCYMEAGRMRAVLSRDDVFAMDGSERVAMGVRSPAFVPRPSLKPAPLAAGLAREGERAASGEAFGARLEARRAWRRSRLAWADPTRAACAWEGGSCPGGSCVAACGTAPTT